MQLTRRALPEEMIDRLAVGVKVEEREGLEMLRDLFSRELTVTIDRVDSCRAIVRSYVEYNANIASNLAINPIEQEMLFIRPISGDSLLLGKCFSYIVKYRLPLEHPIKWDDEHVYSYVDLRLAFVHPLEQAEYLFK